MEALRQIYMRLGLQAIERVGAVVFAAPDIDKDVFASSVERVGALASKITVITATNDRALAVSGWIAGETRVGAAEAEALKKFGVRVIDASHEGWGIINHDCSCRTRRSARSSATPSTAARGRDLKSRRRRFAPSADGLEK